MFTVEELKQDGNFNPEIKENPTAYHSGFGIAIQVTMATGEVKLRYINRSVVAFFEEKRNLKDLISLCGTMYQKSTPFNTLDEATEFANLFLKKFNRLNKSGKYEITQPVYFQAFQKMEKNDRFVNHYESI